MLKSHEHTIGQTWGRIFKSMSKNTTPVNERNQQIILLLGNYNLYQYLIEPGSQLQSELAIGRSRRPSRPRSDRDFMLSVSIGPRKKFLISDSLGIGLRLLSCRS